MKKPLSQLKKYFELADERKLSGSDQLVYIRLFGLFNALHWPETLQVSDRELMGKLRLYDSNGKPASIETLRRARQRLKAKGFIDFESGKGDDITKYKMPKLYFEANPDDMPDQTPDDTLRRANYVRAKDEQDEKDVKTISSSIRTREVKPTNSQDVLHAWREVKGYGEGFALIDLENEVGAQAIISAIAESVKQGMATRRGLHFNSFKAVLDRLQDRTLKGGESVGRDLRSADYVRENPGLPPGVESKFRKVGGRV